MLPAVFFDGARGLLFVDFPESRGGETGRFLEDLAEVKFIGKAALFCDGMEISVGGDEQIFCISDTDGTEESGKTVS